MLRAFVTGLAALPAAGAFAQPDARPGDAVVRYDNERIVSVTVRDLTDLRTLEAIGAESMMCEIRREGPNDYMVHRDEMAALDASGIPYTVTMPDVQAWLDEERARLSGAQGRDAGWFEDYKNLAAIEAYMEELAALRPDLVMLFDIGASHEGRLIRGMRITNDAADTGRCKPAMLLHGTQHAREWITPMNVMYVADQLVRTYDTDAYVGSLVDRGVFYIIPVFNPDGYVYTWTNDRMWRKNRRHLGASVYGVDLNRNWGVGWGLAIGSSGDAWNETYRGPSAFSEIETQRFRDFALSHPEIRAHNDVHSAAELVLWPWGWQGPPAPDESWFASVGGPMLTRIGSVHGKQFRMGRIYTTIYPVSGASCDWFYGTLGILTMSYELRGPGFGPPPSAILPGCRETYPATLYQAEVMIDTYRFIADFNADCVFDILDVLEFFDELDAGTERADINGDGMHDILDVLDFFELLSDGR